MATPKESFEAVTLDVAERDKKEGKDSKESSALSLPKNDLPSQLESRIAQCVDSLLNDFQAVMKKVNEELNGTEHAEYYQAIQRIINILQHLKELKAQATVRTSELNFLTHFFSTNMDRVLKEEGIISQPLSCLDTLCNLLAIKAADPFRYQDSIMQPANALHDIYRKSSNSYDELSAWHNFKIQMHDDGVHYPIYEYKKDAIKLYAEIKLLNQCIQALEFIIHRKFIAPNYLSVLIQYKLGAEKYLKRPPNAQVPEIVEVNAELVKLTNNLFNALTEENVIHNLPALSRYAESQKQAYDTMYKSEQESSNNAGGKWCNIL